MYKQAQATTKHTNTVGSALPRHQVEKTESDSGDDKLLINFHG